MPSIDEKNAGNGSSRGLWLLFAVIVLICVAAWFLLPKNEPRPNRIIGGKPNADDCERLTSRLNEAVGYLESDQLAKADEALSELLPKFSREPAVVRNLAICRVVA